MQPTNNAAGGSVSFTIDKSIRDLQLQTVAICIKIDEICIKTDEMCTKHDEFCTKNDDFNANGQTDNEGPVSCTKSLEGAGTVVTVSKSDAFCTKKRGILYQKRGILYEA